MAGKSTYFKMGDWNATCDYCGGVFKASQLTRDWKGFMAWKKDWEPRQPQDFAHNVDPETPPPWIRPQPTPVFVTTGTSAGAGEAIAGKAITGNSF